MWVKIHTKFLEWEWHDSPETVSLFIHLLVLANKEDKRWHGTVIKRGQLATGLNKLKDCTGLSIQQIRTCLGRLKSTNEITIKSTNKYSIITVCNYATYQDKPDDEQQANQQATQQTSNKQSTTTKEDKRYIKEKSIPDGIDEKKSQGIPTDLPFFEEETPPPTPSQLTPEDMMRIWNDGRGNCPKIISLSKRRRDKCKARIAEFGKTEDEQIRTINAVMKNIRESEFLQFQWQCTFDWLIENTDNWTKVIEGNYNNKRKTANASQKRVDTFEEEIKKLDTLFNGNPSDVDEQ